MSAKPKQCSLSDTREALRENCGCMESDKAQASTRSLKTLISRGDPILGPQAVCAASAIGGKEAADLLWMAAKSRRPSIRAAAASAAPNLDRDSAEEILNHLLKSRVVSVRKFAVISSGVIGTPGIRSSLEETMKGEKSDHIKKLIEKAIPRCAK